MDVFILVILYIILHFNQFSHIFLGEAIEDNTSIRSPFGDTDDEVYSASEDGENTARRKSRQGSISLITKSITAMRYTIFSSKATL